MSFSKWIGSGILLFGMGYAMLGCASEKQGARRDWRTPDKAFQAALDLAPTDSLVQTIQLYQDGSETALPVLSLRDGGTLVLEFDLFEPAGRPLSIYFYHTTRTWQRDHLQPIEYLGIFQNDQLLDYEPSRATEVAYTHYTYQFPNTDIEFTRSGNYILRVTPEGQEHNPLFERAFLVTEQAAHLTLDVQSVPVSGFDGLFSQPLAWFEPPKQIENDVFDFNACFVRNTRIDLMRCAERPILIEAPRLQYYLEREVSFEPESDYRELNLGLLQVGDRIDRVDLGSSPHEIWVEPDFANLGQQFGRLDQFGQTAISSVVVDALGDPDIWSEYVRTNFFFVPVDEQPLVGPVFLTGSFNGWQLESDHQLAWNRTDKRYEISLLLKQGQYEYQYFVPGTAQRARRIFNPPSRYTALAYYFDPRLQTDRLLAVQSTIAR